MPTDQATDMYQISVTQFNNSRNKGYDLNSVIHYLIYITRPNKDKTLKQIFLPMTEVIPNDSKSKINMFVHQKHSNLSHGCV